MSVFNLLRSIENRPEMFIGYDEAHRADQLRSLQHLLAGYRFALEEHDVNEPGRTFLRGFGEYVEARTGWDVSGIGPVTKILMESEGPDEAWAMFWRLVWGYEKSLESRGR